MQSILAMLDTIANCPLVERATQWHAMALAYRIRNGFWLH